MSVHANYHRRPPGIACRMASGRSHPETKLTRDHRHAWCCHDRCTFVRSRLGATDTISARRRCQLANTCSADWRLPIHRSHRRSFLYVTLLSWEFFDQESRGIPSARDFHGGSLLGESEAGSFEPRSCDRTISRGFCFNALNPDPDCSRGNASNVEASKLESLAARNAMPAIKLWHGSSRSSF